MKTSTLLSCACAGLALISGAAAGPAWYWSKADTLIARSMEQRRVKAEKKREEQRSKGWDFWTIEVDNLTNELKEEKVRLRKEADGLDQRAARLAAERQEMEKLRTEIAAMRRDLDSRIVAINSDEVKNLHSLAQTYSTLTPRAAVAIIKEMDDSTVVKILSLMKPDLVGPIFEEMAGGADTALAQHAAVLSDKLRLMKAGVQDAPKPS